MSLPRILTRRAPLRWCGWAVLAGIGSAALAGEAVTARLMASPEPGWPQFRGPRRDGISDEKGLLPEWPEGGPRLWWSASGLGRGFSSPIIAGGRLFITGDFGEETRVLAFDLDGKPQWSVVNGAAWLNQYPGARASVAYRGGLVYHQNAHGRVVCLEAASGRERWSLNLLERFRGENITWGLSDCLLVDDQCVYAMAGGRDALLAALDRETGAERWQSQPLLAGDQQDTPDTAGYASMIHVEFSGRRLLVGCSGRHLFCADAATGQLQWTRPRPTSYAVQAMMPVLAGDAVFMAAPHGLPGRLYRLLPPGAPAGMVGVAEGWSTKLDTCQGGVVYVAGRLYGSYYPARQGWAAVDAASGEVLFEAPDLIKGAVLYADNRLYALGEDGGMLLLNPTTKEFEVKGRLRLTPGRVRDAWAHPVILDGRLYLRYHDTLYCYDIRAKPAA